MNNEQDALDRGKKKQTITWFNVKEKQPPSMMDSVEVKCADGYQCIAWLTDEGDWNMDLPFDFDYILKDVIAWKELTPFSD